MPACKQSRGPGLCEEVGPVGHVAGVFRLPEGKDHD